MAGDADTDQAQGGEFPHRRRQRRIDVAALWDKSDAFATAQLRVDPELPRVRRQSPHDRAQEGRFAFAVRPQEEPELPRTDDEIDLP